VARTCAQCAFGCGCAVIVSRGNGSLTLWSVPTAAHWDEKFHHKMVDNRGFMVTRSYTVGVTMMHRTGRCLVG
jgi:hypothetical protein